MADLMDGFSAIPMNTGVAGLPALGVGSVSGPAPSLWDQIQSWGNSSGFLGKRLGDGTQVQGWGGLGLQAAGGLMSGWLGMQQYGLAKDALDQQKKAFNLNYDAQVKTTNARLNDVASARYASNPNAYQSPTSYMKQYGIGG